MRALLPLFAALALAPACVGSIERPGAATPGGRGSSSPSGGGAPGVEAPARLRRLTAKQLRNSLNDLLGPVGELPALDADAQLAGFVSVAVSTQAVSSRAVEQIANVVNAAVAAAWSDADRRRTLLGCAPGNDGCSAAFVARFGRRAWRRPLSAAEVARYRGVFDAASAQLGVADEAARFTVIAMLQSPHFLYREELGEPAPGGRSRFSSYDVASRLSFFLTDGPPDAELVALADADRLTDAAVVRDAAARLLTTPAARRGLGELVTQIYELDALATVPKNQSAYPDLTPALRDEMRAEVARLYEHAMFDRPGDLLALLDTRETFVGPGLAKLYALADKPGAVAPVTLPESGRRRGLLGTAALLTLHSKQDATSPTARGKFIRERLLCQEIAPPPDKLDTSLKPVADGQKLTFRQQLEQHRANPVCNSCHGQTDPLGFALEGFDAIGKARTTDRGLPVDTTGSFDGVEFKDEGDLGAALRRDPRTSACFVRSLVRYATGRVETDADAPALQALAKAFDDGGHALAPLVAALVTHEAFLMTGGPR